MEQEEREDRVVRKAERREAERDRLVQREIAGNRTKVQPAKDERKGDGHGEQAPPHDEHVREPAQPIPREDEAIAEHVDADALDPRAGVAQSPSSPEERLPAAPPVHGGGRPLQPHGVAIGQAERGEQHGERVAHEGGVEVGEVARTDENEDR